MVAHQMKVQHFHQQLLRLVTPTHPASCSCWGPAGDSAVVLCPFQWRGMGTPGPAVPRGWAPPQAAGACVLEAGAGVAWWRRTVPRESRQVREGSLCGAGGWVRGRRGVSPHWASGSWVCARVGGCHPCVLLSCMGPWCLLSFRCLALQAVLIVIWSWHFRSFTF